MSIWMSYLPFPFIIHQTRCAAFQFRQNEHASSPTVIAGNSFAARNYLDYPLLITAFSQRKAYHSHLIHSLRKQDGRRGLERLLLLLQSSYVIGGPAREIENNTASDHGDLHSRWPKNPHSKQHPTFGHFIRHFISRPWHSRVHVQVEASRNIHLLPGKKKPSGHFSSLSNPSSASVAFCTWQSVWRAAPKANKCLIL